MTPSGLRVGVAFGGRSVEHDVSIITGLQALEVLGERHRPVPIYIARSGRWYTGEQLRDLATYQRAGEADAGGPGGSALADGRAGAGPGASRLGAGAQAEPDAEPDAEEIHFDLHRGRLLRDGGGSRLGGIGGSGPGGPGGSRPRGGWGGSRLGGGSLLRRRSALEPVELDVVVLATHGTQGEDGCLQGVLELARLPYAGPPVGAAAAAMDKATTKALLTQAGLPVLEHLALRREQWEADPRHATQQARQRFPLPIYVKPASLGSSVGVSRCDSEEQLRDALELAFELDRVCLLEPAVEGGIEVNCSVIGRPGAEPRASVCEQPVAGEAGLSFEDKYMRGGKQRGMKGAQRLIPAPISGEQTARIQELAKRAFAAFGCAGVTRVDFLVSSAGDVYVNELNTIPGSFSFYLWEPAGLPFADLMDELIELALAEHREKLRTTTVFATNLLAQRAAGGTKAAAKA